MATTAEADTTGMTLDTNRLGRTGRAQTFAGTYRKTLMKLVQMPQVFERDPLLGSCSSTDLLNCKQEEQRLVLMVAALD